MLFKHFGFELSLELGLGLRKGIAGDYWRAKDRFIPSEISRIRVRWVLTVYLSLLRFFPNQNIWVRLIGEHHIRLSRYYFRYHILCFP